LSRAATLYSSCSTVAARRGSDCGYCAFRSDTRKWRRNHGLET
jgi:hypothetical protein